VSYPVELRETKIVFCKKKRGNYEIFFNEVAGTVVGGNGRLFGTGDFCQCSSDCGKLSRSRCGLRRVTDHDSVIVSFAGDFYY